MKAPVLPELTVFFPAYNEIDNLESVVSAAVSFLPEISSDFEIIIVDDGSSDGTYELSEALAERHECVRVIHHERNRGYGAALQSGFQAARKQNVFYTDGDGQFRIEELRSVLPLMETADVVSCFRAHRQDPWHRILNARIFEMAINMIFGLKIRDPDCAFKIYAREVLEALEMTSLGAMIDVEMLLQAKRKGFRIVQTGVTHLPRKAGEPSGGNLRVILRAFAELIQLWRRVGSRFQRSKSSKV